MHNSSELWHYGVLGMRWGYHNGSKSSSSSSSKKSSTKRKKTSTIDLSKMSDDQLRTAINRMQMEQQYRNLQPKQVNKGKQYANAAFKAGKTVAAVTTTGLTIYKNVDKINKIVKK